MTTTGPAASDGIPAIAATAAAVSWIVVAIVRNLALRRGLLDMPNARSSHARPTPRVGGLGIITAIVAALAVADAGFGWETHTLWPLIGLALAVAAVSLIDDLRGLPALARLAVHLTAGTFALVALGPLDIAGAIGLGGWPFAHALNQGLTVLWIAGFMNAFNFMDGIDGIAAGQAAVAGAVLYVFGRAEVVPAATLLGVAITAACVGFLVHNWPPASIFMGDVGSAFLGFLLATAPLLMPVPDGTPIRLLPFALVVWPFLFDTALTFVFRTARGENVLAAHRSHLYQRLVQAGWSHGRVATLYTALAAGAAAMVLVSPARGPMPPSVFAAVAAAAAALWLLVVQVERRPQGRPTPAATSVEESPRA